MVCVIYVGHFMAKNKNSLQLYSMQKKFISYGYCCYDKVFFTVYVAPVHCLQFEKNLLTKTMTVKLLSKQSLLKQKSPKLLFYVHSCASNTFHSNLAYLHTSIYILHTDIFLLLTDPDKFIAQHSSPER